MKNIERRLREVAAKLNKGWVPDWSNADQPKWCMYYNYNMECYQRIDFTWHSEHDYGVVYFRSPSVLRAAIKEIGEENLIKYYFKVKV